MKKQSSKARLKAELRRLFRSMDFISRHPALSRRKPNEESERLADIYQQLGLAWEFLSLQCRHWDGYRKAHSGNDVCKICGKVKGAQESWVLSRRKV